METQVLLEQLNQSGELQLREVVSIEELEAVLAEKVKAMIPDTDRLMQVLYRIDVDEQKALRVLADASEEDASRILARMILQRQWEKIETRRKYRQSPPGDEDRW